MADRFATQTLQSVAAEETHLAVLLPLEWHREPAGPEGEDASAFLYRLLVEVTRRAGSPNMGNFSPTGVPQPASRTRPRFNRD